MRIGKIIELWRYPVSSLGGEMVGALDVSESGLAEDRRFGLVDSSSGAICDPGRDGRWKRSMEVDARLADDGGLEIRIQGSGWVEAMGEGGKAALADHFGFAAEIRPYADRNPPAYHGPLAVNRYQPSALHLLTTASLAELKAQHPEGNPDRRRFRPNIVVEMTPEPGRFPESEWLGRVLTINGLDLFIDEHTRRCAMTILGQRDIPDDPEILRQLVRRNGHNLGIYCQPQAEGRISLGDAVALGAC